MRLHTRNWGDGERTAVLVHGIMADSRTWHRVAPRIADRGYRVMAVDLRGHGASGRGRYSPQEWADDLVDTLPPEPDVAIGHSLGAVALALAVDRLRPAQVIYSDPTWLANGATDPGRFRRYRDATRDQLVELHARWSPEDIDLELATLGDWDPDTVDGLALIAGVDVAPQHPTMPSLVLCAKESPYYAEANAARMRERGLEVRVVVGAGHTIHRDDLEAFLESMEGWL